MVIFHCYVSSPEDTIPRMSPDVTSRSKVTMPRKRNWTEPWTPSWPRARNDSNRLFCWGWNSPQKSQFFSQSIKKWAAVVVTGTMEFGLTFHIYEQGPPHPPPPPARWFPPPPCGRGGGVFSAAKPIVAGGNHGVCSLYSAYSAYVSIIRIDILYVI